MKKFEKNYLTIALNVLYVKKKKKHIFQNISKHAYTSKHNSKREKQVILLMIPNGEGWHYLAIKKFICIIKRSNIKNKGVFYFLNCLHSFRIKNKLESHKKVCENKD